MYFGEVSWNHLMFADDICVFCPSVRGLQSKPILDVCQTYAESHGIIFNSSKTFFMTFKAKSAKSVVTPLLTLGGQNVKSVDQHKHKRTAWGCRGCCRIPNAEKLAIIWAKFFKIWAKYTATFTCK